MIRPYELGSILLTLTTLGCGGSHRAAEGDTRMGEDPTVAADSGTGASLDAEPEDAGNDATDDAADREEAADAADLDAQSSDGGTDAGTPACDGVECDFGTCCVMGCGGPDVGGTCVSARDPCEGGLVCGCDGVTYGAACLAHASCIAVAHEGACGEADCDREPIPDNGLCGLGQLPCLLGAAPACIPNRQFFSCCVP